MGLADRLAAAKQERAGGTPEPPAPTPVPPVRVTTPQVPVATPEPTIDLTDEATTIDLTDPNRVLAYTWEERGYGEEDEQSAAWAAYHDRARAAGEAKPSDELDLPDNTSWSRRLLDRRNT